MIIVLSRCVLASKLNSNANGRIMGAWIPWTDDQTADLKRLKAAGLSASQISDRFGGHFSRSAIIGKLDRLHIKGPEKAQGIKARIRKPRRLKNNPTPFRSPPKPVTRLIQFGGHFDFIEGHEYEPMSQLSADDIPLAQCKQLFDLGPEDCRWPYGDVGTPGFFFCGAVKSSGKSYCPYHAAVARGQPVRALTPWRDRRSA